MAPTPVEHEMRHSYITIQDDLLAEAIRLACVKRRITLSAFYAKAAEMYLAFLSKSEAK